MALQNQAHLFFFIFCLYGVTPSCLSLRHFVTLHGERKPYIPLLADSFGMTTGASAVLTIGDISVKLKDTHDAHPQGVAIAMAHGAGLRLLQRQVWRDTASFTKEAAWEHCLLNHPQIQPIFHLPVVGWKKSHLSHSESINPWLHGCAALLYFAGFAAWMTRVAQPQGLAARMHNLFGALLLLKACVSLTQMGRYLVIAATGLSENWTDFEVAIKVILGIFLIGAVTITIAGLLLLQPTLSSSTQIRDGPMRGGRGQAFFNVPALHVHKFKLVLYTVVPLQIVGHILKGVLKEEAATGEEHVLWQRVLHGVDVFCFFAILIPLSRLISSGEGGVPPYPYQSVHTMPKDETAHDVKLRQLRKLYLLFMGFELASRLLVYLGMEFMPYRHLWLVFVSREILTLSYYCLLAEFTLGLAAERQIARFPNSVETGGTPRILLGRDTMDT
ncbi:hypothetical protein CYMTET_38303 [Cymbomonas tetramitiformis]|uniref:Uncharacterized protein n=1 Tax=Cymbomonas tetramitiformis TaxID=36881 RepID=A0AAE0CDR4_9CHLO|nr:hypothetical protein CYMTET_38303 [Cymbomonas tetramitiformis]